jgi:YHS domain-containing protein
MDDLSDLEARIRDKLSQIDERTREEQRQLAEAMATLEQKTARFNQVAPRIADRLLWPRVKKLASTLPNARAQNADVADLQKCTCTCSHTDAFPASAKLEFTIRPDCTLDNLVATYNLELLPMFFQFERSDEKVLPIEAVNEQELAAWLDEKILQFVDTYLHVQDVEQYRQENYVIDPVCGMRVDKSRAGAQTEYAGRMFYFCVDECRQKFAADPMHYIPSPK